MPRRPPEYPRGLAVPSGRLSRLVRFGGMATGIAGGVVRDGAMRFARGERPHLRDLLLTPANVAGFTDRLAELRGAAMKIGQLMSMDAGEMLPPELAEIMGRLRADAEPMPQAQLQAVLTREWGDGWRERFAAFSQNPIAAASIGQVHRATTRDGRDLAIKVQYPGIRRSIDSDVDNVATLVRMSGLMPRGVEIGPLLAEAKRQLHEEADYVREGGYLRRFGELLEDDPDFIVPGFEPEFSTPNILAMSFVEGIPVERLEFAADAERDRVAAKLIDLSLRELFTFQLMQTDPNLANYRYQRDTGKIVLLDFGATREFSSQIAGEYRILGRACMGGDREATRQALFTIGLLHDRLPPHHQGELLDMVEIVMGRLRREGPFDFADQSLLRMVRDRGMELVAERQAVVVPPIDTLFLNRKFGGVYLLAARLKAKVDARPIIESYL